MGLKFKKSVKLGKGVSLNLNKKSVGVSFGGKGHRTSVNSKGRITNTVGISGSGLSYTSSTTLGKKTAKTTKSKAKSKQKDPTWGEIFSDLGNSIMEGIDNLPTAENPPKEYVPKVYSKKTYSISGRILQVVAVILFVLGLLLTLVVPFAFIFVAFACLLFWVGRKYRAKAKEMYVDQSAESKTIVENSEINNCN